MEMYRHGAHPRKLFVTDYKGNVFGAFVESCSLLAGVSSPVVLESVNFTLTQIRQKNRLFQLML